MEITRPNQVWAMDITYIPMARGFVYLAVVLDWATRRVLSWRLSITMEAAFCVETLEDALARHGKPEIFNTDQGSQFTGVPFTGVLADNGVAISMDGRGAWRDNVFVERLWRSVKYEEVYLRGYDSVSEARASIGRYLDFYMFGLAYRGRICMALGIVVGAAIALEGLQYLTPDRHGRLADLLEKVSGGLLGVLVAIAASRYLARCSLLACDQPKNWRVLNIPARILSLLAMLLYEKFGQHQPLNRQTERYALEGVPISLSTAADAVGACCTVLEPLSRL